MLASHMDNADLATEDVIGGGVFKVGIGVEQVDWGNLGGLLGGRGCRAGFHFASGLVH